MDNEQIDEEKEKQVYLQECRDDLLFYTQVCDPNYIGSKFHKYIAKKLQDVAEGKIKRLIISAPPRSGKSAMTTIELPTWILGRFPKEKIVLASYAQSLANKHSRLSRQRMNDEIYKTIFKTRLAEGDSQVAEWSTTAGGGYKAVGIGSGLTGRGASILIVDDFLKDASEAQSPTVKENVWEWYLSTAYTRLTPNGAVIIIGPRWAQDDLIGRLTDPKRKKELDNAGIKGKESEWEIINLPAIAETEDEIGRKIGDSIFPEMWPASYYTQRRAELGSYIYDSMYCGRPTARGGNYIPVGHFITVEKPPDDLKWQRYWDIATDEKSHLDYTVGIAGAFGPSGDLYLKDMIRGQWAWPDSREIIKTTAIVERIYPLGIEINGVGKVAYQNLLEVLPSFISAREITVTKDKLTRALPWIAMLERNKVVLVGGSWNIDLITECSAFPQGAHDDIVDAISGVYGMLTNTQMPMRLDLNDRFAKARIQRRQRQLEG